mgnify:CR=1 FL=1
MKHKTPQKKERGKSKAAPSIKNTGETAETLPENQPFLKRLLFGEEKPDVSELEAGSTTVLDILSPTSIDTKSRDDIVADGIFHA